MAPGNVLSIIGCTVLTDELSYVLTRDQDIEKVYIIESEGGRLFQKKLAAQGVGSEMLPAVDLDAMKSNDGYTILVDIHPAGPHDNQNELREMVKEAAIRLAPHAGFCLCFYGLCRNALWKIDKLGNEVGLPMMILTDVEGKDVDDCFGANIGGKKPYLDAIVNNRGTIFVSPGYAEKPIKACHNLLPSI
jgi:hypothetical protein